jgi:ABC-type glycerol-3-phosphate transport system permease component
MSVLADAPHNSKSRRVRKTHAFQWKQLLLWLVLGVGSVMMVGPFYWSVATSFKPQSEIAVFPPTWFPQNPTLEHWISLANLRMGSFPLFFRNSIFVSTTVTILILFTSSITGYVFAKLNFRGRDKIFIAVLAMMMVPFSITLIPSYALMVDFKWIDTYWALIVPILFNPFGIFLMRQFMHTIPDELLDAARIDGASEIQIFFRIIVPLSKSGLSALAIFEFITQWDSFLWPLVILQDVDKFTIPLGLAQFRGLTGVQVGPLCAAATAAVLPVLIVYFIAQRSFIEGITLSGMRSG